MDKNTRLKQLYDRLREIDSTSEQLPVDNDLSKTAVIPQESKQERLAALKARLTEIDSKEENQALSLKDRGLQVARGGIKSLGGLMDLAGKTIPRDVIENQNLDLLSGGTLTPAQMEELKVDPNSQRDLNGSVSEEGIKQINQIAGKDLKPTDAAGMFLEKVGEFGSIPVGLKTVPAIAAVSTGLRELGLDEIYSDLISAIGVTNAKAIAKLPGNVLKTLSDYVAIIGSKALGKGEYSKANSVEKAAEFLQNKVGKKNIPEVVANIENYETPFKGSISEGEAAYRPVTADIADNVGLSQYHRAKAENIPEIGKRRQTNAEVLEMEIDNIASKEASPQVTQEFAASERDAYKGQIELDNIEENQKAYRAAMKFENTATAEDAGRSSQEYLVNRVSAIEKDAQAKASPLYEAAKDKVLDGKPSSTFELIEDNLKKYSKVEDGYRDSRKAKIAIEHAAGEQLSGQRKLMADIKKKYKDDPNMMAIALKEIKDVPHGTYTAGKLDQARKALNKIKESIPMNEKERRRDFSEIIKRLDSDMESIPEIFEARKVYREVMQPANVITENPVLGKLIKQDGGYTRQFTVTPSEIPKRIINGSKSIEGAKALMSEAAGIGTKEHKNMIETIKSYVNSDILSEFVEKTGKINPDKFESWTKSNPGAFILYPELKDRLNNLKNAQVHVNRVIKQNEELLSNFYKNSMESILGADYKGMNPDKIASKMLNSTNSEKLVEEAVELLSKDKTGNAMEGLRRGFLQDLKMKFKSDNFTFATLNDYLKKNKKALSKAFNEDQIEVLEKSKDLLKDIAKMERAGKGTNSDTAAKLMENLAEKTGGKASKGLFNLKMPSWIGEIWDYANSLGELGKLQYLEKAMLNPKMAKFLLQKDIKTQKNFFEAIKNKEDFGKWLRDNEGILKQFKESAGEIGKNFAITSQAVGKAIVINNN